MNQSQTLTKQCSCCVVKTLSDAVITNARYLLHSFMTYSFEEVILAGGSVYIIPRWLLGGNEIVWLTFAQVIIVSFEPVWARWFGRATKTHPQQTRLRHSAVTHMYSSTGESQNRTGPSTATMSYLASGPNTHGGWITVLPQYQWRQHVLPPHIFWEYQIEHPTHIQRTVCVYEDL